MSYIRNVKVEIDNRLDLSGSTVSVTGSLFGSAVSGTTAEFTSLSASLVRINDAYNLPTSDGSTGQVLKTNGAGVLTFADESGGGSSAAAGPDTSIQFNKVGDLSGSSDLTYNYSTGILSGTISQFTGISSSYLALSSSTEPTQRAGTIFYDNSNGLMRQWTEVTGVDIHLGQQTVLRVKNDSGATLAKGKIVHLTGSTNSDTPLVTTASYESDSVSADTLGVVMAEIAADATGYVLLNGLLTGPQLDLSAYSSGDMLYLSSSGDFTNVAPQSPLHEVRIGQVTRATSNGAMFVRIQNGYEIDELHDVLISSKTEGDLLTWDNSTSVWKNTKSLTGSYSINGDITASNAEFTNVVADKITAREYHTELVSASIMYESGSTKFGDSTGDNHQFSGSILLSGSQTVTGDITVNTLKSSTSEVNLYTAFPSDDINIGRASAGTTTTIKSNNVIVDRDLAVNGGDLTSTATSFNLLTTNVSTLRIGDAAGNIYIGTSSPGANVNLGNSTKTVSTSGHLIVGGNATLGNASTDTTTVNGVLQANGASITTNDSTFNLLNATATTVNFGGAAVNMNIGASTGQTTLNNRLIVNGSATGDSTIAGNLAVDTNTLYVDATNNEVGIGKTSPNAKLDVNGNTIVSGTLTVTQGITADSFTGSLAGTATQVSQTLTRGTYLTGNDYDGSTAETWAVDATSTNTASKVVARDASGNFSAGTITAALTGNASSATAVNTAFNSDNQAKYVPFVNTNGNQGLQIDAGMLYVPFSNTLTVGTLVETSTRDIKENIKTIPNQLRKVKKLNPVRYNRINSSREEIGLIAEEVEEVYPEFVHDKGINYPKMVSVLISAVQELTSKVEKQQREITSLKKKIK